MSEDILLDRNLYRKIKNMNKSELNQFIHNVYNTGKEDALSEIEITEIKGIGETRLNKIMDIISKNI